MMVADVGTLQAQVSERNRILSVRKQLTGTRLSLRCALDKEKRVLHGLQARKQEALREVSSRTDRDRLRAQFEQELRSLITQEDEQKRVVAEATAALQRADDQLAANPLPPPTWVTNE